MPPAPAGEALSSRPEVAIHLIDLLLIGMGSTALHLSIELRSGPEFSFAWAFVRDGFGPRG